MDKPKLFLSSGNNKELGELDFVIKIKNKLKNLFDVFLAAELYDHMPSLVKILTGLKSADFFVFIDFERPPNKGLVSVFSYQELAIAADLDIPPLAFRQKTAPQPAPGMSYTWLDNAIPFDNKDNLSVNKIVKTIKAKWGKTPEHRNRLIIGEAQYSEPKKHWFTNLDPIGRYGLVPDPIDNSIMVKWIHFPVHNGSYYKDAFDCGVYVSEYSKKGDTSQHRIVLPGDIKWVGVTVPSVNLYHARKVDNKELHFGRKFAGAMVAVDRPEIGFLLTIGDRGFWEEPTFIGAGTYDITYVVRSPNFQDAVQTFSLELPLK